MAVRNRAALTINLGASQYTSKTYDDGKEQYVFTVEQGTQFYLSYGANTYETLSASDVELYKNRKHLQRTEGGTIILDGSYMDIQTVNQVHEGNYTIKTSSGAQVSFQLKVKATPAYSQLRDRDRGYPW